MKTCSKCGESKPLDEFGRNKNARDGKRADCKVCHSATVRAIYHRDLEKARAANNRRQRRYYAEDPEKLRERARQFKKTNAEKNREWSKRWARANPEKVRVHKRKYEKANPDKRRDLVRARRAKLAGVERQPWTEKEIYARDNGRCCICGIEVGDQFEIDHIVPVTLDGPDIPSNVRVACRPCNRAKGKTLEGQIHFAC